MGELKVSPESPSSRVASSGLRLMLPRRELSNQYPETVCKRLDSPSRIEPEYEGIHLVLQNTPGV